MIFNAEELTQVHDSQLPTTLLQQGGHSLGNFRSCRSINLAKATKRPQSSGKAITRRKDQLGGKRPGIPNSREDAGASCTGKGAARIPRIPSANPIPAGRVRGRKVEGLNRNGSLDQSRLEGAGAPRARSRARRATGHGARGRTGGCAAPGARGGAAQRPVRLTHAASLPPEALPQPGPVLAVSRQMTAVCRHTCTSLKVVSAIPPPARRPW